MSNFLLPVITLPTKINRGHNTLIDNIFTNNLHPDTKSGNLEINLSDGHLPSFLIIPKQNQNHLPKKHNILIRDKKHFNKENFTQDFQSLNWDEIIDLNTNDVDVSLENFLSKFNNILEKHMPLRKMTQREFKQKYKPWISNAILNKIADKNKILKKYIKCKNELRKSELLSQFKNIKNDITNMTRTGKKLTIKNTLLITKITFKRYGKVLKKLLISNLKTLTIQHA